MAEIRQKQEEQKAAVQAAEGVATHVKVTVKMHTAKPVVVSVPVGSTVLEAIKAAGGQQRPEYEAFVDNKSCSPGVQLTKDCVVTYMARVVGGR